jgi:hypothetical protein
VPLLGARYRDPAHREAFVRQMIGRLKVFPYVESVGVGPPPLVGGRGEGLREGFSSIVNFRDTTRTGSPSTTIWVKHVDPGYFDTYGIRVRSGRGFLATDDSSGPAVAVLNSTAARLLYHDRAAIGQSLSLRGLSRRGGQRTQVVGLIDDVLQRDVTIEANAEVLLPAAQQEAPAVLPTIAVRTSASPALTIASVKRALQETDPELAATRLESMVSVIDSSLARQTFLLSLLGVFAGLALVIAVVGLYAVVSHLVAARQMEIGTRLALGAQRNHVLRLVLGEGAVVLMVGVGIGITGALMLGRLLERFIFEVTPHDFTTLTLAPLVLASAAFLAMYLPARRASAVDPIITLRGE